ncbi:MAG TPA: NAD-dependent epimerase/dehydratase family protein [Acidimicrobiales bacterium]|nr:NAD-dependent epimerase/dehydratase family protein [Acidimicrobiales bacterium]
MTLVTGGSGFIGRHLVDALVADGREVRVLVRSDAAAKRVPAGAELVRGDMADAESLRRAAANVDLVFHLAGSYRAEGPELHATHVTGTANLLSVLEPGTRVVYVSSTSVYGWDQPWPADHATPPHPVSPYGEAKLAAEQLVATWTGGPSVIARPTITYGPGDERGMLPRAVKLMARGMRWFPGDGSNRIHLVHVDDLVRGLLLLGEQGDGVYVFGGPEATPAARIIELVAEGAGLRPPRFGLPMAAVRLVARHAVDVLTRDRFYSCARAVDELGWQPQVSAEVGVPTTGAWLAHRRSTAHGFDWRNYVDDPDEGLGTVYERFALRDVLAGAIERTGATSVLHAPAFGMMGFPGLDAVFCARAGLRVGLLDYDPERLEAVRSQWSELGLEPELHLVDSPDPATWPASLPQSYDLAFSFAALWWFDDPWAVLAAQARWADKGVLCCVPNKNVFMQMRARLWHKELFRSELNEHALDSTAATAAAMNVGLRPAGTGLFDIPPFPDTSVPIAKILRRGQPSEGKAWVWSILPYLKGDDPTMQDRITRLASWERFVPRRVAPALAHHRWHLFEWAERQVPAGR